VAAGPKHNRRRPRSWWSLFIRLGGWGAVVAGGILLVLTAFGHFTERRADRFAAEGVVTMGEVVSRRVAISTDSDGDSTRSYYLTLRYLSESGESWASETSVSSRLYRKNPEGADIEMRYLASAPRRIEVPVGSNRRSSFVLLAISLGVGAAGLIMLWKFGRQATSAVKARRDGDELLAEVTGVRALSVEINDVKQGRLQWRDEDGQAGESLMRGLPDLRKFERGDIITVYRRGGEVWWQGDVGPPARDLKVSK